MAEEGKLVAQVSHYQSDIRLKRNDSIHWFPVSRPIDCFEGDYLFSGPDSFATVVYPEGQLTVFPNSLISFSPGKLILEAGTIEVDLKGAERLKVEFGGKELNLTAPSRVKFMQQGEKHRVQIIEGGEYLSRQQDIAAIIVKGSIKLIQPQINESFPLSPQVLIPLVWKSDVSSTQYTVEFFKNQEDQPFKEIKASSNNVLVAASELADGNIRWRVKSDNEQSDELTFSLISNYHPRLLFPEDSSSFKLGKESIVHFQWQNPLSLKQVLQVSRDPSFKQLTVLKFPSKNSMEFAIEDEGPFYWRVGVEIAENQMAWSESRQFTLGKALMNYTLGLSMDEVLDFSLIDRYTISLIDSNNCPFYRFEIFKGNQVVKNIETFEKSLTLERIEDGAYEIKAHCIVDKQIMGSTVKNFSVQSSKPLAPPQIKVKKDKLFVFFDFVLNLLLPAAIADDDSLIEWEGNKGEVYELVIAKGRTDNVILKKITSQPNFDFNPDKLGTYYWRVRRKKENRWSPYTKWNELIVEDKISLLKQRLMVSPEDGKIMDHQHGEPLTFKWMTPSSEYKYHLELRNDDLGTVESYRVSGNEKKIMPGTKGRNYSWRVIAESKHGNKSSGDFNKFSLRPTSSSSRGERFYIGEVGLSKTNYDIKLRDDNTNNYIKGDANIVSLSLNSSTSWFGFDMWSIGTAIMSATDSDLNSLEVKGDLYKFLPSTAFFEHFYGVGVSLFQLQVSIDENNTEGDILETLVRAHYGLQKKFANRQLAGMKFTGLFHAYPALMTPGVMFEPFYRYDWSNKWSSQIYLNYRTINLAIGSSNEFSMQNFGYGLSLVGNF